MDRAFAECRGCAAAAKRIAQLEAHNAALERKITRLEQTIEALSRAGKRQAAPFSRGLPKARATT